MGGIAKVLSFVRAFRNGARTSDVKMDPGGKSNITGTHFADPGDDSVPLPNDFAAMTDTQPTGGKASVGYVDPVNEGVATAGEKRIYSRDPATGAIVASIHLKDDGEIEASNPDGSIILKPSGEIEASNAGGSIILKPSGVIEATATTKMTFTAPLFEFIGAMVVQGALAIAGTFSKVGGGAIQASGGFDVTSGDVTADSISLKTHTHNITSGSSSPGPTAGPN